MDKIFWIEEGRLAGRCGPSVAALDLSELTKAGFRTILSLDAREYGFLEDNARDLERKLIHLPDSIPPKPIEVKIYELRLPEAVDYVLSKLEEGKGAVLVHCHAGNDRTGGVLTGYLNRTRGITPRQALARVRKANPRAISATGYEEMILSVLEDKNF